MNEAVCEAVIREQVKTLRLPALGRQYQGVSRQARDGGWAYEQYLKELFEVEICSRWQRTSARRVREARFPDVKTLDQINWDVLQGISRPKLLELASCEYLSRGEDIVIAGPIGTGKTHLAIALGVEAARRRQPVLFTRAADLVRSLVEARDERRLGRLQQRVAKVGLLILDELGFVPFDRAGGELLFNLLSDRYERRSTLVTTNLAFSEWVQVFGCEKLTTALLDRLVHHGHILTTRGPSFRTQRQQNNRQKDEKQVIPQEESGKEAADNE
jgi:DNA replication protein DnaC